MGGDATRPIQSAPPAETTEFLPRGALAGEYEIATKIASGGCGTVYEAEHRILRRRAAVKVLHRASPEAVHRFTREARAVNLIKHPNIVDVYEYGQLADGRPYYVMEYLEGVTLDARLRECGRLSPKAAFEVLEPICAALSAAHEAGVVHRDIKPSNIFVAKSGIKLLDFGVAKLIYPQAFEPELTTAEHRVGTPAVMAPEQITNGVVDSRTDIYAMGVVLYRVLTGEYPFRADSMFELERLHLTTMPAAPSTLAPLSPMLDDVLLRCMAKNAADRYPSMEALRVALARAVSDDASTFDALATFPVEAKRPQLVAPAKRSRRFAWIAIAALAVLGGATFALRDRFASESPAPIEMTPAPTASAASAAPPPESIVKSEPPPPVVETKPEPKVQSKPAHAVKRKTVDKPKTVEEPTKPAGHDSPFLPERVKGDSPFLPVRPN